MSHFVCVVLVSKRTQNIELKVAELLAPYDEKLKVEPYIYKTRDEVIGEKEEVTKKVNSGEPLPDYMQDYKGKIEQMSLEEFVKSWHDKEVDENGNLLSTYPRGSKWDWYVIGGRWNGEIRGKQLDSTDGTLEDNVCPVSELPKDFSVFAIVTPDGEWHEEGKMGWWAIVINKKDEVGWELEQAALFETYKDCLAVVCDLHI